MSSPEELRLAISALIVDAQVLLVRAQHEQMKAHVRHAQRVLTDASILLDQYTRLPTSALSIDVVDASIKSAKLRLEMVESAMHRNGPDASDLS